MYSYENTYQKGAHSYQFTELSFKRKKEYVNTSCSIRY